MVMQDMMNALCTPIYTVGDYFSTFRKQSPNLELTAKAVVVEVKQEPSSREILLGKLWQTAEKAGDVVFTVATHSATRNLFKGVINQAVDRAELGALQKAVDLLGDKVLPGDVAAIKIAIMLITGFSSIAKM